MKKTLRTAALAVSMPALALAACSSDDDSPSDEPAEVDSGDSGGEIEDDDAMEDEGEGDDG